MNLTTLAGIITLLLVLHNLVYRIRTWAKLRHIPGPRLAAWSRMWIVRILYQAKLPMVFDTLHAKYGPIYRISPDSIIISDVSEIRRIWSVHSGYHRTKWYEGWRLDPNRDNILTHSDNQAHHRVRMQVLPGYTPKTVSATREKIVDEQLLKLIDLIERKYVSTRSEPKPMDMARVFLYFTQDATSGIVWSEPFGYLERDEDFFSSISSLEDMMFICSFIGLPPLVLRVLQSGILKPLMPKPTDPKGIGKVVGVLKNIADKRYGEKAIRHDDILQMFVDSKLSREEVEAEALVALLGGTDTTATTIRMAIFYLSTTPSAYETLQAEIDAAITNVTRPIITDVEAKELKYLQAVIKETLRIWPPISGHQPKCCDTDDYILGLKVPAGTSVSVSEWTFMRDKTVFGADADVFNPMRWIDAEGTPQLKEMEATEGLAFATGTRWECLGKKLAYLELNKVLFELFRRYNFAMTDPVNPFQWFNFGLIIYEHMNVTVTKRNTAA